MANRIEKRIKIKINVRNIRKNPEEKQYNYQRTDYKWRSDIGCEIHN